MRTVAGSRSARALTGCSSHRSAGSAPRLTRSRSRAGGRCARETTVGQRLSGLDRRTGCVTAATGDVSAGALATGRETGSRPPVTGSPTRVTTDVSDSSPAPRPSTIDGRRGRSDARRTPTRSRAAAREESVHGPSAPPRDGGIGPRCSSWPSRSRGRTVPKVSRHRLLRSADAATAEPVLPDDAFPYPPPATPNRGPATRRPAAEGSPRRLDDEARHPRRALAFLAHRRARGVDAGRRQDDQPAAHPRLVARRASAEGPPRASVIDARLDIPTGVEQEGNAAEFKRRAVRNGQVRGAGFDERKDVLRWVTGSVSNGGKLGIRGVPGPPRASPPGAPRQRHRALRLVPRRAASTRTRASGTSPSGPGPRRSPPRGRSSDAVPASSSWSGRSSGGRRGRSKPPPTSRSPATVPARPRSRSSWTQRSPSRASAHGWRRIPPGSRGTASRGAAHQARRTLTTSSPSGSRMHRPTAFCGSSSTGSRSSPTDTTSCVASSPWTRGPARCCGSHCVGPFVPAVLGAHHPRRGSRCDPVTV